jgi:HlyD family secretion protein
MSDTLTSDLASLKIDRSRRGSSAPKGSGSGALKALVWLAVLGGGGFVAYTQGGKYVEANFFKLEVELTEISIVSPAAASVQLTSSGYVVPQKVSQVGAKLPGRVSAIHVKEGQRVKAGDLLLEMERADRDAAVQSARMHVATAEARVQASKADLAETQLRATRERALAKQGVAPAANADDLEARVSSLGEMLKAATAEVKAAESEVAAQQVTLRYMKIEAPIDGTIVNKPPELGELLGMDIANSKAIEIADLNTILVETDVPEGRLHFVKLGSPCEIVLDAYPEKRFRGEAVEISPKINRAKATVGVKVKFIDSTEGVLPEMSARVSFLTEALEAEKMKEAPKTVVPASAVTDRAGAKVVFALDGEEVRMRTIKLGPAFGGGFELIDGPAVGTRLVKNPAATLSDGQRIKEKS